MLDFINNIAVDLMIAKIVGSTLAQLLIALCSLSLAGQIAVLAIVFIFYALIREFKNR
ncbi:hypothetical protein QIG22_27785 [Klebsiella pneumoniae]|jgi:hypothetical protein|uniref:hypothetical protein n=1 Tax=Enterobacterales TaxID=91347 RepID=UPI000ACEACC1|nr:MULTISPECIES: hypothetical protein [Enterobacterales]ELY4108273.1 hypothetical protein [Cronobacter sakazakii]MBC4426067.1 hypothetical protein [Klebsiella variicola]MDH8101686.1 hypothetical protein [Klebsiella pneumoniae]